MLSTDSNSPNASGENSKPPRRLAGGWKLAMIIVGWWLVTACVYRGTAVNFLRMESGWYLKMAHSEPALQWQVVRGFFSGAFLGHYTPVANTLEFATAKIVGTRAPFWKWRQITLVALFATAMFQAARKTGELLRLPRPARDISAAAAAGIVAFQPMMRDFVAWPFMIMQLLWLLCTTGALFCLLQSVREECQLRWIWLAAAAAYASLHCFGLGVTTVAATFAAVAAVRLAMGKAHGRELTRLALPLGCLLLLSAVHSILMVRLMVPPVDPSVVTKRVNFAFAGEALGFIANLFSQTIGNLFCARQEVTSGNIRHAWPFGVALLLGFVGLNTCSFRRAAREPNTTNLASLVLAVFGSVLFLAMAALVIYREQHGSWNAGFSYYLVAPRYLVLSAFALVCACMPFLLSHTAAPQLAAAARLGVAACVVAANLYYAAIVQPHSAPRTIVAHGRVWRSIVSMTGQCLAAGLPIPNLPITKLTDFTGSKLQEFEPLLRADLNLPLGTTLPFTATQNGKEDFGPDYRTKVPALHSVQEALRE